MHNFNLANDFFFQYTWVFLSMLIQCWQMIKYSYILASAHGYYSSVIVNDFFYLNSRKLQPFQVLATDCHRSILLS